MNDSGPGSRTGSLAADLPAPGSSVGNRYLVHELIGRGGMGAVFGGHDISLDRPVAIKLFARPEVGGRSDGEQRFLTEGRALARVTHEACVRIYDCGLDVQWGPFLIMERLTGEPLSQLLRARGPLPLAVALALLEQLCAAVRAVHEAGIIHRDIKPGNVFVLHAVPAGGAPRIKLLDFGIARLASEGPRAGDGHPDAAGVDDQRGTVAYMAPERWLGPGKIDARADVYALGVIAHEMLAGAPPYRATTQAGLRLAIVNDPPERLSARRPDLPERLVGVIERALNKSPGDRYRSVEELSQALGLVGRPEARAPLSSTAGPPAPPSPRSSDGPEAFVGRNDTLEALQRIRRRAPDSPRIVLVEGPSGIGKTALLERFRRTVEGEAGTLVLAGRAREGDVPYPALAEVMEDLVAYLLGLPTTEAEDLLPKRCRALAQLFPALARIPAIARAPEKAGADTSDAAQALRHACAMLRELFWRLCEGRTVVVLIDDLHWIDADGAAILADVLGGYDPPPLLLVAAVRAGEASDAGAEPDPAPPPLQRLRIGLAAAIERVTLGPLSNGEARALVRASLRGPDRRDARAVAALARQSAGVPFFAVLLAAGLEPGDRPPARLEDFLARLRLGLPDQARAALELICLSSRPLPLPLVLDTLSLPDARPLDPLFTTSLVRWTKFHERWAVEPYHGKIREAVRISVPAAAARGYHRELARRLRIDPDVDPEILVEHLASAGDVADAAEVALTAARRADGQLAFDRAAALYGIAARHRRKHGATVTGEFMDPCESAQIRALQNAGRRREAAEVVLEAMGRARDPADRLALATEAGAHLLLCGEIERGLEVLAPALTRAGLRVPASFAETLEVTTAALGALLARGLVPREPPAVETDQGPLLTRLDLSLLLAQGLAHIDLRVVPFACHALQAALDAGEPTRLQRACALFVINTVEYLPNPLVGPALDLCRRLTAASSAPLATAMLEAATAEQAHFEGDFLTAEAAFERAERTLLQSCPGATRELATVRDLAVFIQYAQKGDFRTQVDRTQRWLAQAEAARDLFHASMLRVAHAIVWIAHDDPARARSELHRAQAGWTGDAGVLGVAVALYHDIIDRYEERDLVERATPSSPMRSALLRNPAAQTPFLSGYLVLQDAWVALRALAAEGAPSEAATATAAALRGRFAELRRLGLRLWSAVADALEGNLDYLEGAAERAVVTLGRAEEGFRRLHMLCLAACARKRRGQLGGGEMARRLEEEADAELRVLGVANPERWARAYWSMFEAALSCQQTDAGSAVDQTASIRLAPDRS